MFKDWEDYWKNSTRPTDDFVRARCENIEQSVQRLEALAARPLDEFLADRDVTDVACYRLLAAIAEALALCRRVSDRHLRETPEDDAGCFAVFGQAGILTPDLTERLQGMTRFRDLLVHSRSTVDLKRFHALIRQDLGDLRAFAAAIVTLH